MKIIGLRFYRHRLFFTSTPRFCFGHDQYRLSYTAGFMWRRMALFVSLHVVYLKDGKVDMSKGYASSFGPALAKKGWMES